MVGYLTGEHHTDKTNTSTPRGVSAAGLLRQNWVKILTLQKMRTLHDIGKGIDYRIEGSHAVISADYADRYGENQIICNTVMVTITPYG